jgi:hypothetical protein
MDAQLLLSDRVKEEAFRRFRRYLEHDLVEEKKALIDSYTEIFQVFISAEIGRHRLGSDKAAPDIEKIDGLLKKAATHENMIRNLKYRLDDLNELESSPVGLITLVNEYLAETQK